MLRVCVPMVANASPDDSAWLQVKECITGSVDIFLDLDLGFHLFVAISQVKYLGMLAKILFTVLSVYFQFQICCQCCLLRWMERQHTTGLREFVDILEFAIWPNELKCSMSQPRFSTHPGQHRFVVPFIINDA